MNLHDEMTALIGEYRKGEDNPRLRGARNLISNYNDRRKAITAKMKPVLERMQVGFEAGKQIGGCGSMKEYCKTYKPQGMITYARCRQIITGKSGNEGKVKSLDLLKELITVISKSSPKAAIDKASAICDQIKWLPPDWKKENEDAAESEAKKKDGNEKEGGAKEGEPMGEAVVEPKHGDKQLGLSAPAQELEETLDSIEPVIVGNDRQDARQREQRCDYTDEEITRMFAKGGN